MDIQLKQQLKNTLINDINALMREYDIPASDMEVALESILCIIKDSVMEEYMADNIQKIQKLEQEIEDLKSPKEEDE